MQFRCFCASFLVPTRAHLQTEPAWLWEFLEVGNRKGTEIGLMLLQLNWIEDKGHSKGDLLWIRVTIQPESESTNMIRQYEGRKDVAGIVTHPSFLLTVNASSSGRIYCKNFFRINYTREEAGRWTLMMKNMGNWSRLEKGNGMGGCTRQQQMRTQRGSKKRDPRLKSQDRGNWTQDTGHRAT